MVTPRWPDWFLVGAPRCGTTSMFAALRQHPQLYVPAHKEPHFFGTDLTIQPHTVRDASLYLTLFKHAAPEQKTGEASVWYLHSQRAAEEIYARNPNARILVMLRDPVEMIRSLHALFLRTGNEDLTRLQDALDAMPERRRGQRLPATCYFPEGLQYLDVAQYDRGIQRFVRTFGAEQVKLLNLDDFHHYRGAILRSVFGFLGVNINVEISPAGAPTPARVRIEAVRQLRQLKADAPTVYAMMRHRGIHHSGPKVPISDELRARLRAAFDTDDGRSSGGH